MCFTIAKKENYINVQCIPGGKSDKSLFYLSDLTWKSIPKSGALTYLSSGNGTVKCKFM